MKYTPEEEAGLEAVRNRRLLRGLWIGIERSTHLPDYIDELKWRLDAVGYLVRRGTDPLNYTWSTAQGWTTDSNNAATFSAAQVELLQLTHQHLTAIPVTFNRHPRPAGPPPTYIIMDDQELFLNFYAKTPEGESFLWSNQRSAAWRFLEADADAILQAHPHKPWSKQS